MKSEKNKKKPRWGNISCYIAYQHVQEEAELKEKHEREQREQAEYSQWKVILILHTSNIWQGSIEIAGTGSKADDLGELDKRIDEFITLLTVFQKKLFCL